MRQPPAEGEWRVVPSGWARGPGGRDARTLGLCGILCGILCGVLVGRTLLAWFGRTTGQMRADMVGHEDLLGFLKIQRAEEVHGLPLWI